MIDGPPVTKLLLHIRKNGLYGQSGLLVTYILLHIKTEMIFCKLQINYESTTCVSVCLKWCIKMLVHTTLMLCMQDFKSTCTCSCRVPWSKSHTESQTHFNQFTSICNLLTRVYIHLELLLFLINYM